MFSKILFAANTFYKEKDMKGKRISMQLKSRLTTEEREAKGANLAMLNSQYDEVEEERKQVTSEFSKQLKEIRSAMRKVSNDINAGEEIKMTDCLVRMHDPMPKMKTTIRLDTGEVVSTDMMSEADLTDAKLGEIDDLERMWQEEQSKGTDPLQFREPKKDDEEQN